MDAHKVNICLIFISVILVITISHPICRKMDILLKSSIRDILGEEDWRDVRDKVIPLDKALEKLKTSAEQPSANIAFCGIYERFNCAEANDLMTRLMTAFCNHILEVNAGQ